MKLSILLLNIAVISLMCIAAYASEHNYLCAVIILTGVYITLNQKL